MNHDSKYADTLNLVKSILTAVERGDPDGTLEDLVSRFNQSVPRPHASDLIFWPDQAGFDLETELTAEQITDLALDYSPPTP